MLLPIGIQCNPTLHTYLSISPTTKERTTNYFAPICFLNKRYFIDPNSINKKWNITTKLSNRQSISKYIFFKEKPFIYQHKNYPNNKTFKLSLKKYILQVKCSIYYKSNKKHNNKTESSKTNNHCAYWKQTILLCPSLL